MIKKTQLSPLGWIAGIIIALAISIYFGSIAFMNNLFELISTCIFIAFEGSSAPFVITNLLTCDFDDEGHNLYRQINILHLMSQLATIGFIAIFNVFANADISCAFIIMICICITFLDILIILISINWNEITLDKTNRETKADKLGKLINKLKSKLLTTKVINNKDKIKWK